MTAIITISRQFGSGGRYVGKLLAEALDIPYYDRELISLAAEKSGLDAEEISTADEHTTSMLFHPIPMGAYALGVDRFYNFPIHDKLFELQSDIIREIASQGPCVIIGRCADWVLRNEPGLLKVFIHGSLKNRVQRGIEHYGLPAAKAEKIILREDKQRAAYYEYYTGQTWGLVDQYHICLDGDFLPASKLVALLKTAVDYQMAQPPSSKG